MFLVFYTLYEVLGYMIILIRSTTNVMFRTRDLANFAIHTIAPYMSAHYPILAQSDPEGGDDVFLTIVQGTRLQLTMVHIFQDRHDKIFHTTCT
jgi:hypothetical protein